MVSAWLMSAGTAIFRNTRASSLTVSGSTVLARQQDVVKTPNSNVVATGRNILTLLNKKADKIAGLPVA
jgi:hypothetical protein